MSGVALGFHYGSPVFLADLGQTDVALAEAGFAADRGEAAGDIWFTLPRSVQVRLLAERGDHDLAPSPDSMLSRNREAGNDETIAFALSAAARLLVAQGQRDEARALLTELDRASYARDLPYYPSVLSDVSRTALALDEENLARRLIDGVEPLTPLAKHALTACRAQLAEAVADHAEGADLYADAAGRWLEFGNVPERAYALLGHGRCLLALDHAGAEVPLAEARDLFASMGYRPALAEAEKLLSRG